MSYYDQEVLATLKRSATALEQIAAALSKREPAEEAEEAEEVKKDTMSVPDESFEGYWRTSLISVDSMPIDTFYAHHSFLEACKELGVQPFFASIYDVAGRSFADKGGQVFVCQLKDVALSTRWLQEHLAENQSYYMVGDLRFYRSNKGTFIRGNK